MDLREKKTLRAIKNSFLQLRSQKALERITVKELCELSEISKTTFYLHYKDIYDLSEALQGELIEEIMCGITHPEYFLSDSAEFTKELCYAYYSQQQLVDILFSGTQAAILPVQIEKKLRAYLSENFGPLEENYDILLTYLVQGSHSLYREHSRRYDTEKLIHIVGIASKAAADAIRNDSSRSTKLEH